MGSRTSVESNSNRSCNTARPRERTGMLVSLAGVLFDAFAAGLALDGAAPVEAAGALPTARVLSRVVTATAAHQVAPVRRPGRRLRSRIPGAGRRGRPVAPAAARSQRPGGRVRLAVARRRVEVDEVAAGRLPVGDGRRGTGAGAATEPQEDRAHGALAADRLDAPGAPVARRQAVADVSKLRQSDPASPHRTRPGHAVTLALSRYRIAQRLQYTPAHVVHEFSTSENIPQW